MKIQNINKQDRPREKLIIKGQGALSNLELLQVIIGSGVSGADVTQISRKILKLLEDQHGKVTLEQLTIIKGVSTATAAKLIAALELTSRFSYTGTEISTPEDALPLLADIRTKKQEHFVVLTLDGANRLIEKRLISVGTLNVSLVHPREVFADAITDRSASIIVAHNHPSETLEPSEADLGVTRRLAEAGELLGIRLIDHLIVTKNQYVSIMALK